MSVRRVLLPLLALLAALVAAGPAHAAVVGPDASGLRVSAAAGEANALTIAVNWSTVDVTVPVAGQVSAGGGTCYLRTSRSVRCARPAALAVDLGDGDDTLTVTG